MRRPSRLQLIRGFSRSRRAFLRQSLQSAGALGLGVIGGQVAIARPANAAGGGADSFGPLLPADANGLMLPAGFTSRIVAEALTQPVGSSPYNWHRYPDGGATFAAPGGGWIYVSNSEAGAGGVGAIEFASDGTIVDAYSILTGTAINCAGGPTPWDTWLSCEEFNGGRVFECDPFNASQGVVRAALGTFKHEAAAVDATHQHVYLTEDQGVGLLYRSLPTSYPDLSAGTLEAAEILDPGSQGPIAPGQTRPLAWHAVPEANPLNGGQQNNTHTPIEERATRFQAPAATTFNGGEGCWYHDGVVYFSTKGDARIWALDTNANTIEILYDQSTPGGQGLTHLDNVYVSAFGDVYVAEDPGDLQIVALTPTGNVVPVLQVTGQSGTEITGPALSPNGTRLYFSSQRAPGLSGNLGVTYEVTGPFLPTPAVPSLGSLGRMVLATALGTAAALGLRGRVQI
jgi:secreted PhoX family phosphatase